MESARQAGGRLRPALTPTGTGCSMSTGRQAEPSPAGVRSVSGGESAC